MKKRFIHPKSVLRTVLAVVLSACLVCSVPVVTANAVVFVTSFDSFRLDLFTNSANNEDLLYLPDSNQMPSKTIIAHNSSSAVVTQWQGQYADTAGKRSALAEGYFYDICEKAYSASVADPFILKSVQARQACWLETVAHLKNVTAAAYASVNIAGMTNSEFETFRGHLMLCNGLPECIRSIIPDIRTLNATVEEFLYAAAVIDEIYGSIEEIGKVIHRAAATTQNPDYEDAALRIEEYTDFARGYYTNYYVPVIQNIINTPNFDPTIYGETITDQLWYEISADLIAEQINANQYVKGMFRQTAVSNDPLLDNYNEMSVLSDFHDSIKEFTLAESTAAFTPPAESLLFPAFKTLFASGALINKVTLEYANSGWGSGMFVNVVEGDTAKELEFLDRLSSITDYYDYCNKGIDRVHFNYYLSGVCPDAAGYLNIQPEPPGSFDSFESDITAKIAELTTLAYTTGDVVIDNSDVFLENFDFYGDMYIEDNLNIYQCNPIVEGSVFQNAGALEPMDGSLTVYGSYEITGQGVLHLLNPDDYVKVFGKFKTASAVSHANCLIDGALYVGGDFIQSGNSYSFQTSGNHKTVLFGNTTQHVSFDSTDSGFTQLELQNDDIVFDTALRSLTLYCDLTVSNNWDWQANILDLNGFILNVNGDFTVSDGEVRLFDGELNVSGDMTVTGTGLLQMMNPGDRVNVGGDFLTDTLTSHSGRLTEGIMTVQGDFTQMGDPQSFAASNDHTVVLNAPQPIQTVSFAGASSSFYRLRLMNDYPADYSFTPSPCWNTLEVITTVNSVHLNPRLTSLVFGDSESLNPSVLGKNLSSPAYTLSLSGNNSPFTFIANDILYTDPNENSPGVTVTITSTDDPTITYSILINLGTLGGQSVGDLDLNGVLSINDATMLQENLAEMFEVLNSQQALSDFNNDGNIDVRDVTAIQRRLAELE